MEAFLVSTGVVALGEMGDKTQLLANVPAVFLGDRIAKTVSTKLVHGIAAVIFAILGVQTLFNVGKLF